MGQNVRKRVLCEDNLEDTVEEKKKRVKNIHEIAHQKKNHKIINTKPQKRIENQCQKGWWGQAEVMGTGYIKNPRKKKNQKQVSMAEGKKSST